MLVKDKTLFPPISSIINFLRSYYMVKVTSLGFVFHFSCTSSILVLVLYLLMLQKCRQEITV